MTAEENVRLHELCKKISTEKDPAVFAALVAEMNELFKRKERRLEENAVPKAS